MICILGNLADYPWSIMDIDSLKVAYRFPGTQDMEVYNTKSGKSLYLIKFKKFYETCVFEIY